MADDTAQSWLTPAEPFRNRHVGATETDVRAMLDVLGLPSLDALADAAVPDDIRLREPLNLPAPRGEHEVLADLRRMAQRNQVFRSFIGMGYYDCHTPPVILRNILENPAWYTPYTPYQAEISQGRLEALLNFQTMVADLTGLPLANASLLDEGTAAAEAMAMCKSMSEPHQRAFFASQACHPQTLAVIRTRAQSAGLRLEVGAIDNINWTQAAYCGLLLQYPATDGAIRDYHDLVQHAHDAKTRVVVATDLLALTLFKPPGEFGADIAVGSSQRFGVPLGFGGPHAAFLSARDDCKRHMPGRIVGVSKDRHGRTAYRLALQTREQHIRRDRATSNICTAQALLASMAGMYAVYHGPHGLTRMAERVHGLTAVLAEGLARLGCHVPDELFFDTLRVSTEALKEDVIHQRAEQRRLNLRAFEDGAFGISLDETTTMDDVETLWKTFSKDGRLWFTAQELAATRSVSLPAPLARTTPFLTHEVFHRYHAEHELLRYMHRLQSRDLSLVHAMIPLGSCTMKLNATAEMLPVTWPQFSHIHPFAPAAQTEGYAQLFGELEAWLAEITGCAAVSLQPNAGSQGEYAGLMVIRAWHESRGQERRNVCLIPASAHGTNPASAVIAGLRVVPVACDAQGNVDLDDVRAKAEYHHDTLAALMVTYPSTHGAFEATIQTVCRLVHEHGGQVYMDGANMNAMVGLCRPGDIGADVCHLNLHKTFCIPHGGGGPGMGPIAVAGHLVPFLPGHPVRRTGGRHAIGPVSAAPYGSPSILPISWAFIALMGGRGLTYATKVAMLNANYMAGRLEHAFSILYTGAGNWCAHEFIVDLRPFKKSADIEVEDIAKRLMDFGFHAPTISWPVAGTMMIEPTESESKAELDRYCEALLTIREEIAAIEAGRLPRDDNPLKHAPHTIEAVTSPNWNHPYSREQAALPLPWLKDRKCWPSVARIDSAYGDRHLVCTCPAVESYREES